MKFKRPKITTMLTVFALIIYAGVLIITIQTATIEGEEVNRKLAEDAARLEIEVAELEFAIGRYLAYETARQNIENLRAEEIALEDRIAELEEEVARSGITERNEAGLIILRRSKEEIEIDIARAEIRLAQLRSDLDTAIDHFNAVDASRVIAEIARDHLGLELPGEIVIHESGN